LSEWLITMGVEASRVEEIYAAVCPEETQVIPVIVQQTLNATVVPADNIFCDRNILVDVTNWIRSAVYNYYSLQSREDFCRLALSFVYAYFLEHLDFI